MFSRLLRRTEVPVSFHDLDTLESSSGRQALAIYESAFPASEREPASEIAAMLREPSSAGETHHFRIMQDRDGSVAGIALFTTIHANYMAFLQYIATRSDLRGRGYGAWMLRDVIQQVRRDGWRHAGYPYLGVVLEVERPADAADSNESILRSRRISWYLRNGARPVKGVDLIAPPVTPGEPAMRYSLLFVPAVWKRMAGARLRRMMVGSVLVSGYGEAPESWYMRHALGDLSTAR